jgi:phosphotransferase system enzyme I (PtsI)
MGIPALVNVGSLDPLYDGETALLDAVAETLLLAPTEEEELAFLERVERERRIAREHEAYLHAFGDRPAVTQSGRRILIYANIGDGSEVESALAGGAEGIGLLRSEFLYLGLGELPSEETLLHAYADVVLRMGDKRTVIRTLDAGADKQLPYLGLPQEENPALGMRAIRICLARREMFKTQLRAILRASALGHLAVMLPMIVSPAEVRACRALLEECMRELTAEGKVFDQNLEFGIMIETPAAALQARELAEQVDFFSVGTNDLLQYTLAADRQNPLLAQLCEENREPVLRLIGEAADAIHEKGGWIGVCGEMAADLRLTQRLLALGVDELSVAPPYLLSLRRRVTECE